MNTLSQEERSGVVA